jgi:hypothetical protein
VFYFLDDLGDDGAFAADVGRRLASGARVYGITTDRYAEARALAALEIEDLDQQIEILACHHPAAAGCHCRPPNTGLGVRAIVEGKLSPRDSVVVGPSGELFAARLGIRHESKIAE